MSSVTDTEQEIMDYFDGSVRELGQEDYRELLENVISNLQSRLDCVIEEMQAEGID